LTTLKINGPLTTDNFWSHKNDNIKLLFYQRLKINNINKKRLRCLQILCLEKLEQFDRIDEIKFLNPIIYDSCLMKY
jgi:hypothetical protein